MKHLWVSLGVRTSLLAAGFAPAWAEPPVAELEPGAPFELVLERADRRFVSGDLSGALELLEPACARGERSECAFSLGAIHHGLGHCPEARAFYRRYLELWPGGERASEVRDALEEVDARCGDALAGAAPEPSPPPLALGIATAPRAGLDEPSAPPAGSGAALAVAPGAPERSLSADLAVGSFVLSGAAALTSIAFGLLAAHDASRCAKARTYDRDFIERCESSGPRYQGLWQGFALASGSFLGIGLVLWGFDPGSPSAAASPAPQVGYRGRF
jgi:hypothetical protein